MFTNILKTRDRQNKELLIESLKKFVPGLEDCQVRTDAFGAGCRASSKNYTQLFSKPELDRLVKFFGEKIRNFNCLNEYSYSNVVYNAYDSDGDEEPDMQTWVIEFKMSQADLVKKLDECFPELITENVSSLNPEIR